MITVSLIKELFFISQILNQKIDFSISFNKIQLNLSIDKEILFIYYNTNLIWKESLNSSSSFFGVESCQQINKIVEAIINNKSFDNLIYTENP